MGVKKIVQMNKKRYYYIPDVGLITPEEYRRAGTRMDRWRKKGYIKKS